MSLFLPLLLFALFPFFPIELFFRYLGRREKRKGEGEGERERGRDGGRDEMGLLRLIICPPSSFVL